MNSIKDIWRTLKCLPFAVLVHDSKTRNYKANNQALKLFKLEQGDELCANHFGHIKLISPLSKKPLLLQNLFDVYLIPNVLNNVVLEINETAFLLNIKFAYINETVSMITFEIEKHKIDEQYNFDVVISNISADLIDIQNDNVDGHINYALKAIGTVCHADRSYLFKFNDENSQMSNTHEWVNKGIVPFKDSLQDVPKSELPYFFKLMNDTYLFKVNDVSDLPASAGGEKKEFELQKIKSVLCIGLSYEKELVGFIGCDCVAEKREWTNLDLIRIKLVGEILTNAFKNINYKQKLELAQQQLITANQKLSELVNTDGLTTIANRRCFDKTFEDEIQRCVRYQQPISLIICDIDFFKKYNDSYGHLKGDEALKYVAETLQNLCKRPGDLAARYGGEEFAIILPCTDSENANCFSTLIQNDIARLNIEHNQSDVSKQLTLSIGFYSVIPNTKTIAKDIISKADAALYHAKESGRNKISEYSHK
ncbi:MULTISPECIES: diguanylate cyclase [unclassified Pseudoalteromonas]|uniref:sensor domain-containing diguanylate cyclase n=1 Tax=unclassified Pseudoalteromonas TaxID=194690 RepID=UPI001109E9C7|nr:MULTISPECIES: diguanylate cyclase [unclassified Pseudoalteromonas]TMN84177.1 GGDEF domain-containing protein [Pseudoalteromonas sp. S410]TMN90581.1 GGDEF domain-containing protein [Pseudoalteromonas sp. S408]TMN95293.1 GGDEF domain-containing protein [Pseudoalteromonas sp. S407]TMN97849.1 GGDEF domain-containing protein [Pseudoalteromonas sp. S409]TMO06885.1 GGDEF domain-containing protein [Pseudoalteromonas sp. S186]